MVDSPKVNTAVKFVSDNWFSLLMLGVVSTAVISVVTSVAGHREEVRNISVQNAGCIYLESSKLGEGQHYMICNGQITLKRLQEGEELDPEQALQEAIPDATNSATPTLVTDKK
jgi:hypothetical protein